MPTRPTHDRHPGDDNDPRLAVLRDGSTREILSRLVEGDPLALRSRVATGCSTGAWLLNQNRLVLRTAARIAFEAGRRSIDGPLDVWLDARLATAIEEMLGEQAEEEFALRPIDDSPDGEYYRGIATAMDIEADLGRLVCARANRLPLDRRRIFYAFAIERRTVEECSALGWGDHDRLLELFSQAVVAITGSLDRKANHDPNGSDPA